MRTCVSSARTMAARSAGKPENESDVSGVIGDLHQDPPTRGPVNELIPSQQGIGCRSSAPAIIAVSAPVAAASSAVTAITARETVTPVCTAGPRNRPRR